MKKWIMLAVAALGISAAGTAFGLFVDQSGEEPAAATQPEAVGPVSVAPRAAARSGAGGCGSGGCGQSAGRGGCCGSGSAASAQDPTQRTESIKAYLTRYFAEEGGPAVTVEVEDFGCHQEAQVLRDGVPYKRFSISGNRISEIS